MGDEDLGQMGSCFVMMAMGLFEMDGGCSQKPIYEIGSPLFSREAQPGIGLPTASHGN